MLARVQSAPFASPSLIEDVKGLTSLRAVPSPANDTYAGGSVTLLVRRRKRAARRDNH